MSDKPKVAITGAFGFLGWHLSCRLLATRGIEPMRLGRVAFADPDRLAEQLATVDTVIHVAGVNRADTDAEVEDGNVVLAKSLIDALRNRPVHVVYADTVHAGSKSAYGRGKRRARELLNASPGTLADVRLPNIFGEHGRPAYNSFVATFCHEVAAGRQPTVSGDRSISLLHVQEAAESLISAAERRDDHEVRPGGEPHRISEVLGLVNGFHEMYANGGEMPDLSTPFRRDLFNTYRACLFPHGYPIHPQVHVDQRGTIVEAVRSRGGTSQSFASTTGPGATRGDHYHLHKIERFMVIRGEAEIALRRLFHDDVVRFRVEGSRPAFVDMPTLWAHSIRNVGQGQLITIFWTDQLLNAVQPDQYPLKVEGGEGVVQQGAQRHSGISADGGTIQ